MPRSIEEMPADKETGFLPSPQLNGFTIEKKKEFIRRLMDYQGDASITRIAQELNVSPTQVLIHIERDKAFSGEIKRAKEWFAHRVEGVLQSCALDPKKTIDRIAYLRAYMPDKYARQELQNATVEVNLNFEGINHASARKIVDAEVVSSDQGVGDQGVWPTNSIEGQ